MARRLAPLALIALFSLFSTATFAAPTLGVSPSTVDWNASGTIVLNIGGITGASAYVRIYADVNGDGILNAGDYVVWTDVARDNVTEWSPNMLSDTNPVLGSLTLAIPPLLSPFRYPHTAGSFLWQVEDSTGGALSPAVAFIITQTTETQTISGTVQDMSSTPVPGALVVLLPLTNAGEPDGVSCFADQNGNYTLNVPASRATPAGCAQRMVIALKPGYVTPMLIPAQPVVTFTGASVFTGKNPKIRLGTMAVIGQVSYSNGPKSGQGIPGVWVWADSSDGPGEMSVALADRNGNFSFLLNASPLSPGGFTITCHDPTYLALQGAVGQENYGAAVNVNSGPFSGNLQYRAADAFIQGTARNASGGALGSGMRLISYDTGCFTPTPGPCYWTEAFTRADGTYTLGVVGGTGNAQSMQFDVGYVPAGWISTGRSCDILSIGQTLTGADLALVDPTASIKGRFTDQSGTPLADLALTASLTGGCTSYIASAVTDCAGEYDLPVINGNWSVSYQGSELNGLYRNLDEMALQRAITISGASVAGVNYILGKWGTFPSLNSIEPPSGQAGAQVLMKADTLTFSGATPLVYFGAIASPLVIYRADLGYCIAEVPAGLTPGDTSVTAVNPDTGFVSNAVCFSALSGTWTPSCTLSGVATNPGGGGASAALVLIRDSSPYRYCLRTAVSDGSGNWSAGMAAAGNYNLVFIPPAATAWAWGTYSAVACGTPQNHAFLNGYWVSGTLKDDGGSSVENGLARMPGREECSLTDSSGYFAIPLANGTYNMNFNGPVGGRLVGNQGWSGTVSGSGINVGTITLNKGTYFIGHTLDQAVTGLADVRVNAQSGTGQGRANSLSCNGQFNLAMTANLPCVINLTPRNASSTSAEVRTVSVAYDTFAEYDFVVPDPAAVPAIKGNKPAIEPDYESYAQAGQPIHLMSESLSGTTVQVRFSNGAGGFVVGTNTFIEPARSLMVTTVPAGAATGEVWINVDGQDGPPAAFTLLPGSFSPGSLVIQGTVTAASLPVEGVGVLAFQSPAGSGLCEGTGTIQSYATTNALGQYSVTTNAGNVTLMFMPPGTTQLSVSVDQFLGLTGGMTLDKTLVTGYPVHVRLTDSLSLAGIQNGRVQADGKTSFSFDTRLTDASGDATLYLSAGDYETRLSGPVLSRYIDQSNSGVTISGATDLGTVALTPGYFSESRFTRGGVPIPGMEVESSVSGTGWTRFSRVFTDAAGVGLSQVPANTGFNVQAHGPNDSIADYTLGNLAALTTKDVIRYPSDPVPAAGVISGRVTAVGGAPLQDIEIQGYPAFTGSDSWTRSCSDGYYHLKAPLGSHYVLFNGNSQDPGYVGKWWNDTYCQSSATSVNVLEGATTSGVNAILPTTVTITGRVRANRAALPDAQVCAQGGPMGSGTGCSVCTSTDISGNYTLSLLAGSNYQVNASFPGYPLQNYNHHNTTGLFNGVTAPATGINFDLGDAPTEPSNCGSLSPFRVTRLTQYGPHVVRLSFEKIAGAESYSIYQGLIGGYYASGRVCNIPTTSLVDDGATYHYDFSASTASVWFLISDSNVASESPITQTGACGATTDVDPISIPRCGATP